MFKEGSHFRLRLQSPLHGEVITAIGIIEIIPIGADWAYCRFGEGTHAQFANVPFSDME